ncbi:hypothetical protein D9758_001702 [Tetrapyrgos nigripes]|uniref:Cytochrome b561 domain-containing protein n=1 Tax=Tetrapyrgos nigripes TaxID=182062 RepID=A0A8H5GXT5_9AGAR|nr:hypothetical protein D9758_001702 [Tetrapyrgos nigripes]
MLTSTHPGPPNPEDYELLLPSQNADAAMGQEEQFIKSESRSGDRLANYVALGAAVMIMTVTWFAIFNNLTGMGWFALHPPLQTLALVLFTYGILTLQPTSQPKTKAAGLGRHQVIMFMLGLPIITIGSFAVWYNKYSKDKPHLVTWHGVFGLVCMLWLFGQVALGGASVWFGGAALGGGMKAKAVWKYHRLSGYILFPLLLTTVNLGGAWSGWAERNTEYIIRLISYTVCPLVILAAVYSRVRTSKMKFF